MINIMDLRKPDAFDEKTIFINQLVHQFNEYKTIYESMPEDDTRRMSYKGLLFAIKDVIYDEQRCLIDSLKY